MMACTPQEVPLDTDKPVDTTSPTSDGSTAESCAIEGQLTVQSDPNVQIFSEREPNNDPSRAQFVTSLSPASRVTLFGRVNKAGDPWDHFAFNTDTSLSISFTLSFVDDGVESAEDLDLAMYDFVQARCSPGDVGSRRYTRCFDTTATPERGTFTISGPFLLAVSAYAGSADYQLDLTASLANPNDPEDEQVEGFPAPEPELPIVSTGWAPESAGGNAEISGSTTRSRIAPAQAVTDLEAAPASADELLVRFQPDVPLDQQEELLRGAGLPPLEMAPDGTWRARAAGLPGPEANGKDLARLRKQLLQQQQADLLSLPMIASVEPNPRRAIARAPDDVLFELQWHYQAINLPEAWNLTTGSDEVIIAVVDTGILSGHPDLQGRLVPGYDFIADPQTARDGDGRDPNPEDPGDLFGGPGQSSFHGTHVAGTLVATTNNSLGVAGITWQGKIMPLRALGAGGGTAFDVAEAIRYAAGLPNVTGMLPQRRADVINLSLVGAPGEEGSQIEMDAIADAVNAGVVVVAAAGNNQTSAPAFPAATPEAISVSALDIELKLAPYSNFGASVDLAAPGGYTGTDRNGDTFADGVLSTGGHDRDGDLQYAYVFSNGTSMAAPHVAGVAALVMAANPTLDAAAVRDILESTAVDLGAPGSDEVYGHGLLDAAAAVREASRRAGANPTPQPGLTLSTQTVDLGYDRTDFLVQVRNTGGGYLEITSIGISDGAGGPAPWLNATRTGTAPNANAAGILIEVDRTDLDDGSYGAVITLGSPGLSTAAITVTCSVGPVPASSEIVYVLAVDPSNQSTVRQTTTRALDDYAYVLDELPAGSYILYAGTDRDNDGTVCEIGDLCGALPSSTAPQTLSLIDGERRTGMDFAVARLVLQQITTAAADASPAATGPSLPPTLRRLR